MKIQGPLLKQSALCQNILSKLPDWFGIEEATQQYIEAVATLPTFVAEVDGQAVGFISLKQHNPYAAEVYVMGILPTHHRQGIGRKLLKQAKAYLRGEGVEYLQVKTLSPTHPDPHYARTRLFYEGVGFRPLEEIPDLWDEGNPCLIMIKAI